MKCDAEVHVGTATPFAILACSPSTRPNNNAGRLKKTAKTSGKPFGNAIGANRTPVLTIRVFGPVPSGRRSLF